MNKDREIIVITLDEYETITPNCNVGRLVYGLLTKRFINKVHND